METINDYKLLKKHYNEKFAQLCRELFPTILEEPGKLYDLISKHFAPNKFLYSDIVTNGLTEEFKEFIYKQIGEYKIEEFVTDKTPEELLDEAGYTLYECKTQEDIDKFKKYFEKGEELCTFRDDRLSRCHVFFAVKKNVDEIKRENFPNPERQDEYGTSVISIQFTKDSTNRVSIKNRYNHKVPNPDATFGNNLDRIAPGLRYAFNKKYNLNSKRDITAEFELPGYVSDDKGKFYKFNHEINGVYYCINNVIVFANGQASEYDKARCIVFDYFLLDLKTKEIISSHADGFLSTIINEVKKIDINVDKETRIRKIIINDNIIIELDDRNRIIGYTNPDVKRVGSSFLEYNYTLQRISLENAEEICHYFLAPNNSVSYVYLPKVKKIGSGFLMDNSLLSSLYLPEVEEIGDCFIMQGEGMKVLELPNVRNVGKYFLENNTSLFRLNAPKLKRASDSFLKRNLFLEELSLPELEALGRESLEDNCSLRRLYTPKLTFNTAQLPRNPLMKHYLDLVTAKNFKYAMEGNNKTM